VKKERMVTLEPGEKRTPERGQDQEEREGRKLPAKREECAWTSGVQGGEKKDPDCLPKGGEQRRFSLSCKGKTDRLAEKAGE